MDLYFNNVSPTGIRWNNNVVTEVQYNNVKIWPSTSYYDPADYDLTQATYMVKSNNANVPFNIGNDCSPYDIYEVKLQWKPNTQSYHGACLFGCASPSRFALFRELTAYFDYGGNGRRTVTTGSYNSSTIYTYRIWCDSDNVGHIKNVDTDEQDTDTGWACNHSPQNMSSALSLSIFYATDSGTIYYVKVYADDGVTLKHWWVPCSNNTTGYLCWFDLVTANITNYQNNSGLYTDSSIVLSASSTTTNQLAGSFNISVEGLVTSVTSDAAWLTYTNSGDNYTISATRQTTNSARSGHITFSNSTSTATFTYTQNFDSSISCTNVNVTDMATTNTITVTTIEPVVSVTLDADAQQFVTLVTQTINSVTYTIDIAANTGTSSRTGTITFYNGYNSAVSTITQTGTSTTPVQVEYIQHDNTHKGSVNLGVIPTTTMKFEFSLSTSGNSGNDGYAYFGQMPYNQTISDSHDFRFFVYSNSYLFDSQNSRIWTNGYSVTMNAFHDIELGNYYVTDNNQTMTWTGTPYSSIYYNTEPLYIFYTNDSSTLKFKYVKIYDNNVLVNDFIPVLYQGVYTMYDQLNDTICTVVGNPLTGGQPVVTVPADAAIVTLSDESNGRIAIMIPNQKGYTGNYQWINGSGFNKHYIMGAIVISPDWKIYDSNLNSVIAANIQTDTPYYLQTFDYGEYCKNTPYGSNAYNTCLTTVSGTSTADQYYFEATGTSGEYHLYTYINGTKYYLRYLSMDYHYYGNSEWDIPSAMLIDEQNNIYN